MAIMALHVSLSSVALMTVVLLVILSSLTCSVVAKCSGVQEMSYRLYSHKKFVWLKAVKTNKTNLCDDFQA